jgi:hypothetical protein
MSIVGLIGARTRHAVARRMGWRLDAPAPSTGPESLVLESSSPGVRARLRGVDFLELYRRWERIAGPPVGRSGPLRPVFAAEGDRFTAVGGLGPAPDPQDAARIVGDVLGWIDVWEAAALDPSVATEPWLTLTFRDPPGSVPDVRHAYPCPRCGQPELLRHAYDRARPTHFWRSHRCGADLFAPEPGPAG